MCDTCGVALAAALGTQRRLCEQDVPSTVSAAAKHGAEAVADLEIWKASPKVC